MRLTVGSLFAGIGGFDLGFERAGAQIAWQVEREPFCQRILSTRFAQVPLFDDVMTVGAANLQPVDIIVGGFPCQDVSVAGKQEGLSGERSGLFWQMVRIAAELKPKLMVIENVPGLLTASGGRDFHTVLRALAELGFRRTYRILDSRYFGVAQRRRRVFLVLCAGDARQRARSILFESESGAGRVEAGTEAGSGVAATLRGRSARRGVNEPGRGDEDDSNLVAIGVHTNQRGELRTSPVAGSLTASKSGKQYEGVAFALRADPGGIGQAHNTNFLPVAFDWQSGGDVRLNCADKPSALQANQVPAVLASSGERERALTASKGAQDNAVADNLIVPTLSHSGAGFARTGRQYTEQDSYQTTRYGVRRLTPLECERVQGFPDGWTCLCGEGHRGSQFCKCPDTPRYKALGNAVTVNVAEWLARRIHAEVR